MKSKYFITLIILFAVLNCNASNIFKRVSSGINIKEGKQVQIKPAALKAEGQIPILAWHSIPASETSLERYQEMKDAGITCSFSSFSSLDDVLRALDVASEVGVQLMVSCPELKKEPEKLVKRLMDHQALAGYHLKDEPGVDLFPELSAWANKIQSVDNEHFCYVNLFPNFAGSKRLGTDSYVEYVQEYIKQIPVQFVSFDYYPIMKDHIKKSWYENLAYGAQGIQYFTYWSATSKNSPSGQDHRGAPISANGKRNVVYDRVKQLSGEIQNLSAIFLGAKVISIRHTGLNTIPVGTIRLTSLPEAVKVLDTHGAPALVSVLQKGENSFLIVVNKDFLNNMKFTVYGDESLKRVLKDGTVVSANAYESSMELDPGDLAVYMFPTEKNQ